MRQSAAQCDTVPHSATQYHKVPHSAAQCHKVPHSATKCHTVPHSATTCSQVPKVPHSAAKCHKVPHRAALCRTVSHCSTLCRSVLQDATLCRMMPRGATPSVYITPMLAQCWHNVGTMFPQGAAKCGKVRHRVLHPTLKNKKLNHDHKKSWRNNDANWHISTFDLGNYYYFFSE